VRLSLEPNSRARDSTKLDSVHGDDATYIAKEYLKSIKNLKKWRSGLYVLNIRQGLEFQSVLQFLLLSNSKSVELYAYESREWKLTRSATPGNTVAFEDELTGDGGGGGAQSNAVFMAVYPVQRGGETVLGVAFVDTTLKTLGVSEFVDNEQLANFESILVQVSVCVSDCV
jgi:DNA mismatch repair protein MSH2